MVKKYHYLLFDIDDTLLDFEIAQRNAFEALLADFNIPFTMAIYEQYNAYNHTLWKAYEDGKLEKEKLLDRRFAEFLKQFDITVKDGRKVDDLYRSYLSKGNQLIDGALELVESLASKGYILGIVTNGVSHTQRIRLANNHLIDYFPHLFISDEMGVQKPDSRFFDVVKQTLNIVDNSKVLLIGDNLIADILGGQNAGFDTCWVNKENKEMTLSQQPTMIVETVKELIERLDECFNGDK